MVWHTGSLPRCAVNGYFLFKHLSDFKRGLNTTIKETICRFVSIPSPDFFFAPSGASGSHISFFAIFPLHPVSSYSSSSSPSSYPSLLLTRRLLVNPLPVFSFTHPLLSPKPFRPPKSLQLRQISPSPARAAPPPSLPPHTHRLAASHYAAAGVFWRLYLRLGGFFDRPGFGCRSPRDLRSIDRQWRAKKTARRREGSASVSIHPLILPFHRRKPAAERAPVGRRTRIPVCLLFFFLKLHVFLVPELRRYDAV